MIGHNGGPTMQSGAGFRRVAWTKARTALMPTLPLEVVRLRVKRAKRLGLPYKTYATIRAVNGRDIVGFLFSDNALGMGRSADVGASVKARLQALEGQAARLAAVHLPKDPAEVFSQGCFEHVGRAPALSTPWRAARDGLRGLAFEAGVPLDGLVVVAATALEREWSATAGFAGTVPQNVILPDVA